MTTQPSNKGFKVSTPINVSSLQQYLDGYYLKQSVIDGFTYGFSLGTVGYVPALSANNHRSVSTHLDFVRTKLSSEILKQKIKGPFKTKPFHDLVCSPLGVVPKKDPNSFRLIHDLSYPSWGSSVNSFIPKDNSEVCLELFDDVAKLVLSSGYNCEIAKADIEDAYRVIPMSPLDFRKLGFSFDNKFYFDTALPMGASSSVAIFEKFSCSLQWSLKTKCEVQKVSHIIDDFIFVGSADTGECLNSLNKFMSLAKDLNLPIKHAKTVLPSTCVEVHGIMIDTKSMIAKLPQNKVQALRSLLNMYRKQKKVTLRELQSLLGHLNFACRVIKPGRCFLRRLYDKTMGINSKHHYIKLNNDCRADIQLWHEFIHDYNGCTLLTGDRFISNQTMNLFTDSAGSKGFGIVYSNEWTFGCFPLQIQQLHINILELDPIALAVVMFGHLWSGTNVLFISDNLSVVYCLNKQTSKDKIMMKLIRFIVLKALKYNFCFKSKHISSSTNIICDKLSRLQVKEALQLAPHLNKCPAAIPLSMTPWLLLK